MVPVSNDTLLPIVRRRNEPPRDKLAIISIDDFAFRRGQRYGTIVCHLERRRPVTLLPDREQATSQAWLANHPSIVTVARDRGRGYGEVIARARALARTPSARSIARPMTLARDDLSKPDAVLIAAIESNVPDLITARTLIDDFQQMIRSKAVAKLDAWLDGAKASLVGSFANGVEKDIAAVRNSIISP